MNRRDDKLVIAVSGLVILCIIAVLAQSAWVTAAASLAALGLAGMVRIASGKALIIVAVIVAAGGDLLFVTASTGGAGVLPLAGLIACALALLASWRIGYIKAWGIILGQGKALLVWTGLGILLPALGILFGFPGRTIASAFTPLGILAFVWLGASVQSAGTDVGAVVRRALIPVLWIVLFVGLSQYFLYRGMEIPSMDGLVSLLEERVSEAGRVVIYARASGFYANPNTLSFLGGLTAVLALADRQASWIQRILVLIPSLGLMAIGQSRIAILSFTVSLVIYTLGFMSPGPKIRGRVVGGILAVTLSLLLLVLVVREWAPQISSGLGERLTSMISGTSSGASVDASVEGRVEFWKLAWSQFVDKPMGTLGPPQMVLEAGIDNEYFYTLVQGGVIYLAAEIWFLFTAFTSAGSRVMFFSRIAVVYVFIVGLSQSVTALPPSAILWILLGSSLTSAAKPGGRQAHA